MRREKRQLDALAANKFSRRCHRRWLELRFAEIRRAIGGAREMCKIEQV
jgi:hypothetical protein